MKNRDRTLCLGGALLLFALAANVGADATPSPVTLAQEATEPDPEVLALGEEVYIDQCLMCHGKDGRGDGPAARFEDPPPRDLTAGDWRYAQGGTVEEIYRVLVEGVDDTGMLPFGEVLDDEEMHATAVYVHEKLVPRED